MEERVSDTGDRNDDRAARGTPPAVASGFGESAVGAAPRLKLVDGKWCPDKLGTEAGSGVKME